MNTKAMSSKDKPLPFNLTSAWIKPSENTLSQALLKLKGKQASAPSFLQKVA